MDNEKIYTVELTRHQASMILNALSIASCSTGAKGIRFNEVEAAIAAQMISEETPQKQDQKNCFEDCPYLGKPETADYCREYQHFLGSRDSRPLRCEPCMLYGVMYGHV